MSKVNVWLAIPTEDRNGIMDQLYDADGAARTVSPTFAKFREGVQDPSIVDLFSIRTQGPNSWNLWSVVFDTVNGSIQSQVNDFRLEYPGTQVLGAWNVDGSEFGTTLQRQTVPNPAYDPNVPDTIPHPNDPDRVIFNKDFEPEFIDEYVQVGTPVYEQSDNIGKFMPPDVDEFGNPVVNETPRQVFGIAGWGERRFSV